MKYDLLTKDAAKWNLELHSDQNISLKEAQKKAKASQELDIKNSIGFDGETREEVIANSSPIEQAIVPHGYKPNIEGMEGVIDHITDWII